MTAGEAVATLAPLVGAGGLSGVIIAFLGWRQSVQGRKEPTLGKDGTLQIGAILVSDEIGRQVRESIDKLTLAVSQGNLVTERYHGEIARLTAHIGQLTDEVEALRRFKSLPSGFDPRGRAPAE